VTINKSCLECNYCCQQNKKQKQTQPNKKHVKQDITNIEHELFISVCVFVLMFLFIKMVTPIKC